MGTATATARMTADEFLEFVHRPENEGRWFELVRGEVIELPPPTKIHGVVSVNVAHHLWTYARDRGKGYITTNDAGTLLERNPDTVRGPDIAYFTDADRFEDLHPKYGEEPPVLAVEVLSPNDRAGQILAKVDDYLRSGVKVVWLIDPENRTVRVYRPNTPTGNLTGDDEIDGGGELPGLRCPVRDFFVLPPHLANQPAPPNAPPAS